MDAARERPTGKEKGADDEVRVVQSPTRCPFCHEDVAPDPTSWVACGSCLARHHAGCWGEGARCGACGSGTKLAVVTPARPTDEALEEMLRDGRSADAVAALRAAGTLEGAITPELGRVALAALAGSGPRPRFDKAWIASRGSLALQAVGFLLTGLALLVGERSPEGNFVMGLGMFLAAGVAVLVPLVAALMGLGSRLRMVAQIGLSGSLVLAWFMAVFSVTPGSMPREQFDLRIAMVSLLLAVVPAFILWAQPRPARRAGPG